MAPTIDGRKTDHWFARTERRMSAKTEFHINDAEWLELVGSCRASAPNAHGSFRMVAV
jgi:hypothetical protein